MINIIANKSFSHAKSAGEPINLAILKLEPYQILLVKLIIKFYSDGILNCITFEFSVPFYFFLS